jgi:hypothetical protein
LKVLSRFRGTKISLAPSRGVKLVFENEITDIILLFQIVLVCLISFMREKEKGQLHFLRTHFYGRQVSLLSKIAADILFTGIMILLMYGTNIFCGWYLYGLGPLGRSLQSVSGYIGTGIGGTVASAMVLFLLHKWLYFSLIAVVILFFMILCNSIGVYTFILAWMGISSILYRQISDSSHAAWLKNINIIAYLHTGRMFASYRCINLFGNPVSYQCFAVVSAFMVAVAVVSVSVYLYSHQKITTKKGSTFLGRGSILGDRVISIPQNKTWNLFWEEGKKIFLHERVLLMLLFFAVCVFCFTKPIRSIYFEESDVPYKSYIDRIQGAYSDEKWAQILQWKQDISGTEAEAVSELYEHAKYIQAMQGDFYYSRGYELLTGGAVSRNQDGMYALLCTIVVIVLISGIYSRDRVTGMDRLLRSGAEGRRMLTKVKLFYGIFLTTLVYITLYGSWFYSVLSVSGTDALSCSVTSMEHINGVFSSLRVWQYLCFISLKRYIGFLVVMLAELWISKHISSRMAAMLIMAGCVMLPLIVYLLGVDGMKYLLINPLLLGN